MFIAFDFNCHSAEIVGMKIANRPEKISPTQIKFEWASLHGQQKLREQIMDEMIYHDYCFDSLHLN